MPLYVLVLLSFSFLKNKAEKVAHKLVSLLSLFWQFCHWHQKAVLPDRQTELSSWLLNHLTNVLWAIAQKLIIYVQSITAS